MSINSSTKADHFSKSSNGEAEETTPLLGNGSVLRRASGASFISSVFNLMNGIMGSGILGLAYAMASTGIIGFCFLLVLVASMAAYSIHLLLKLCDQTGINSYEDLGERALKKPGKVLVGLAILIQNIGAMSSYLFILKSELPAAIVSFLNKESTGNTWYEDGRLLLILVTVCFVLPLAMLPKIGFLSYTSSLAFILMLYFTIVVVIKKWSIACPPVQHHNVTTFTGSLKISNFSDSECTPKMFSFSIKSAYAIPMLAFSFLCHTAILPIYCELDRPTKAKMQRVANISISLSLILYFISALFGYLTFYSHVQSELLLGYDAYLPRDVMVMTVRLAILFSVVLTVPLTHFPARKAVIVLLYGGRHFSWMIHIMSTLFILSVVLLLAVFVPDIRNVFGVVGSTMSSCLLFVFPGLFYLKITHEPLSSIDSILAMFLVCFGLVMGVISLFIILFSWMWGS